MSIGGSAPECSACPRAIGLRQGERCRTSHRGNLGPASGRNGASGIFRRGRTGVTDAKNSQWGASCVPLLGGFILFVLKNELANQPKKREYNQHYSGGCARIDYESRQRTIKPAGSTKKNFMNQAWQKRAKPGYKPKNNSNCGRPCNFNQPIQKNQY
jgi:hypothetical protein